MIQSFGFILAALLMALSGGDALASVATKVANEVVEQALDTAAKISGRPLKSAEARVAATQEVRRIADQHGKTGLEVVTHGGLELLEAMRRYGDDLITVAAQASPRARRALALNIDELLPLTKTLGVQVLEVEAKAPGQASNWFKVFGTPDAREVWKQVPAEDLPRFIKYGEMADSDATRRLLIESYRKEGAGLFARVPPQLVLSGGLTAAMLVGTYRATAPFQAVADVLREHPMLAAAVGTVCGIALLALLLWRFGLMPWQRSSARRA